MPSTHTIIEIFFFTFSLVTSYNHLIYVPILEIMNNVRNANLLKQETIK